MELLTLKPLQRKKSAKEQKLEEQQAAIQARLRQERSRLEQTARKADTRRKVLAGAAVLHWAERDSDFAQRLMKELDGFLDRNDNRALFGLAPRTEKVKTA